MVQQSYSERVHLHGLPSSIINNNNPMWISHFWTDLLYLMGVELKRSTAYHLKMDGQSKQSIKTIFEMLRVYVLQGPTY